MPPAHSVKLTLTVRLLYATSARHVETVIFNVTVVYGLNYVAHVVGAAPSVPLTGIMLVWVVASLIAEDATQIGPGRLRFHERLHADTT